jgi:S1-C subfamily serine protease
MVWGRHDDGAGFVRRLKASCALALALLVGAHWAVAPSTVLAQDGKPPLAYHGVVLNGTITGSTFQISDGLAITNAHVLGGAAPGAEVLIVVHDGATSLRTRARLLAVSRRMDLAVLAVPPGLLPVAPTKDAPLTQGQAVRAAGVVALPSGPGPRMELPGQISSEIVTILPFGPGLIAEMPGIRRGFSGGPVFDAEGRLVGMVAALRQDPSRTRSATGEPLAGQEAFVLAAPAIRAEAARLLAAINGR